MTGEEEAVEGVRVGTGTRDKIGKRTEEESGVVAEAATGSQTEAGIGARQRARVEAGTHGQWKEQDYQTKQKLQSE